MTQSAALEAIRTPSPPAVQDAPVALEVTGLRKSFQRRSETVEAVRDVSFSLAAGEVLALLGLNGAGKTTTVKMIGGLIAPDAGEVRLADRDSRAGAASIGAVLEGSRNLYWRLTAIENLEYFAVLRGLRRADARAQGSKLLERLGLADAANRPVRGLSRGMQQRVAVAAALVHSPSVLLLDEPTLGVDYESTESIVQLVRELKADGCAVLLTTHQLALAEKLSDRVAILKDGEVVAESPTERIAGRVSADAYAIEVVGELGESRRRQLDELGARVDGTTVEIDGPTEALYAVLAALAPVPLERLGRDQGDFETAVIRLARGK